MRKVPFLISPGDADKLISDIKFPKYRMMIQLMYSLALRVGELAVIRICDINFDRKEILINGKGSKERLLPLSAFQLYQLSIFIEKYNPRVYLFENSDRLPYTTRGIRNIVYDSCSFSFGHSLIHPHTLRHCRATGLVNKEVPITKVQRILGHARLETTSVYLHYAVDDLRDALSS
jgi:site-specific recombinase XerD